MVKSLAASCLFLALAAFSCSAADPVTNKFDCHDVCQRYSDCFPSANYDVAACSSRCESDAANSDLKQAKLDDCHKCIGEKSSCVADIASCGDSCSSFVP